MALEQTVNNSNKKVQVPAIKFNFKMDVSKTQSSAASGTHII